MVQLDVRGLYKSFGAVRVAENISISVDAGAAVGVLGPNGAGKTSFFNLVSGDLRADSGSIWFDGTDITSWGTRKRARAGIARTYQVPQSFTGMTVFENVLVGAIFAADQSQGRARQSAREILERTRLARVADTQAGALTLLDRKRLELARALSTNPKLLLLDEIAGGLTDAECVELVDTVGEINARGVTVIWIEHVVHALLRVVRRLAVLNAGRLIGDGEPDEVMRSAQVQEIYLGVEPESVELASQAVAT